MGRSVKLMLMSSGAAGLTHSRAKRGYAGRNPVVEISDVPDGEQDGNVLAAYQRCVISPIMHAETPVPWIAIAGAKEGQVVRLTRGRPEKPASQRLSERVSIRVEPELAERWARTQQDDIRRILREQLPKLPG